MKKPLLKALYPFIIMMIISLSTANAQIVYTDVSPDILRNCNPNSGCSGDYSLDFNNDGMNDFVLSPEKWQRGCGACGSLIYVSKDGYAAVIRSTDQSWIADTMGGYALNTRIDSSLDWTNADHVLSSALPACVRCTTGRGQHFEGAPPSGPWSNIQGKYLALKTQVGNDIYYGWVKLGVGININFVTITIMEYAYNSIPNAPILAGQTMTTGVFENHFSSSISLYPNPANDHLTVAFGSDYKKMEVNITDITGKKVYSTTAMEAQQIELDTKDFAEGIYVVQFQTGDVIGTKKLVVKK